MQSEQLSRLMDVLESARLIRDYVANVSYDAFAKDRKIQDAVIRRIEIMGEAVKHLSEETRKHFPDIPFRSIRGMRNIVTHDYGNVSIEAIWDVACKHVVAMIPVIEKFLKQA